MLSVERPSHVLLDLRLSVTNRYRVSHVRYVLKHPPSPLDLSVVLTLSSRGEDVPPYVRMVCPVHMEYLALNNADTGSEYRQSCHWARNSVRPLSVHTRMVLSLS